MRFGTKDLARQGVVAALYAALCLFLTPISYGEGLIEFRVAEMLMILLYFDKKYAFGLTIGCLIANLAGPVGVVDAVFGAMATGIVCLLAGLLRGKSKRYWIGAIAAAVNGIIVGLELWALYGGAPLWAWVGSIFAGEIVVVETAALLSVAVERNGSLKALLEGK